MTKHQVQLLRFIKEFIEANNGKAPNYEEMMDALGVQSKSGIHRLVSALVREGYLYRSDFHARGLRVLDVTDRERSVLAAAQAYASNPDAKVNRLRLHTACMEFAR